MNVPAYLAVFALLIGLAFGVHYTMEVDRTSRELQHLQIQLKGVEGTLDNKVAIANSGEEILGQIKALQDRKAELIQALQEASSDISDLKASYHQICDQFPTVIEAIRDRAVGEKYDSIETADGKVFKEVRLLDVTNDDISIFHSNGTLRIEHAMLPPDMSKRFRMGKRYPTDEEGADKTDKDNSALAMSAEAPLPDSDAESPEIRQKRERIAKLEAQIDNARYSRSNWEQEATRAEQSVAVSRARGRPTWREAEAAKVARATVRALDGQIAAAEVQLAQLKASLEPY